MHALQETSTRDEIVIPSSSGDKFANHEKREGPFFVSQGITRTRGIEDRLRTKTRT